MSSGRSTRDRAGRKEIVVRAKLLSAIAIVTALIAISPAPPGYAATSGSHIAPVRDCAGLAAEYTIPGTTVHVTTATPVAADPATASPAYCDVQGFVEQAVRFQLKLPTATYSGRYVQYGCDGLCGLLRPRDFPRCGPTGTDFAVAVTDDGHEGAVPPQTPPFVAILDGTWAANNQAARDDYFFRAPHVVSLAAKRIIAAYYGAPPATSYFNGCSTGGREGLLLAQRYPHDFDGIVAGAPANIMGPLVGLYFAWLARTNIGPDGSPVLTFHELPALHSAVLAACDGLDGLADGQIDDPRACRFDPARIQCPPGTAQPTCLTPAQVAVARKLYDGPRDAAGHRLYPGWESYGSELAWEGSAVPYRDGGFTIAPLPDNYLRYVGYPIGTPSSSVAGIQFTKQELDRLTPEGVKGNALSLDLHEFREAGGKLILWHGWADQSIPTVGTADYYQRLWQAGGGLRQTQQWARLFLVPTKYHCELGGELLSTFDPFPALVGWVEHGQAPESIVATGTNPAGGTRSRPVFPYPLRARYDGSGSVDDASNFVPAPPLVAPHTVDWLGTYLYHLPGPVA
jgi:hypothetical protein